MIELIGTFCIECAQQLIPLFSAVVHLGVGALLFYLGSKFGGGK